MNRLEAIEIRSYEVIPSEGVVNQEAPAMPLILRPVIGGMMEIGFVGQFEAKNEKGKESGPRRIQPGGRKMSKAEQKLIDNGDWRHRNRSGTHSGVRN